MHGYNHPSMTERGGLGTRSTPEVLAARLREAIADGSLAPGQALHQEDLSARFGVSRSPLREALRQLEGEGLVDYQPNRGAIVATLTRSEIRQIYEIRRILESSAIRLAMPHIDAAVIANAKAAVRRLREAAEGRPWARAHWEFHAILYAAAHRPMLVDLIARHHVRLERLPDPATFVRRVRRISPADHRSLLEACVKHDADGAAACTTAHLGRLEEIALALTPRARD
jgi:DNA-binding GntR family transcriptional regulator